jgi:hypothetical protein
MNISPTVAISTQDHILASLLFDYIVPINNDRAVPKEVNFENALSIQIPKPSLDEAYSVIERFTKQLSEFYITGESDDIIDRIKREKSTAELISQGKDEKTAIGTVYLLNEADDFRAQHVHRILRENNIRSVPIFHSTRSYQQYLSAGAIEAIEITLNNAKIIDTSKLEWKHVLDIRRDKNFSKQLRNFRLFLNNNYQGKI